MLLDTSAWIELFSVGPRSGQIEGMLTKQTAMCPLSFAEVSHWCVKNNRNPLDFVAFVKNSFAVLELNTEILIRSGKVYVEERKRNGKISLIDAIVYATARYHGLELLTLDRDFVGMEGVQLL